MLPILETNGKYLFKCCLLLEEKSKDKANKISRAEPKRYMTLSLALHTSHEQKNLVNAKPDRRLACGLPYPIVT